MMQQLLEGAFRSLLSSQGLIIPEQGFTLEHVAPTGDRMDAQLSHLLQNIASCNIVTAAMFTVARPIVDTTIRNSLQAIGASGLKANGAKVNAEVEAKSKSKNTKAKVIGHVFLDGAANAKPLRRRKNRMRAKDQIIDAEFVSIPSDSSTGKERMG